MKQFKDTTIKAIVTVRGISPLMMKRPISDVHGDFPFVPYGLDGKPYYRTH